MLDKPQGLYTSIMLDSQLLDMVEESEQAGFTFSHTWFFSRWLFLCSPLSCREVTLSSLGYFEHGYELQEVRNTGIPIDNLGPISHIRAFCWGELRTWNSAAQHLLHC